MLVDEERRRRPVELGELHGHLVLDDEPAATVETDADLEGEEAGLTGVLDALDEVPERFGQFGVGGAFAELADELVEGSDLGVVGDLPGAGVGVASVRHAGSPVVVGWRVFSGGDRLTVRFGPRRAVGLGGWA